jgi:Aspartyl protease
MKFPYSTAIAKDEGTGDFVIFRRPEIPIEIAGQLGRAEVIGLVDTGSDHTIFPASVAEELGIELSVEAVSQGSGFGGQTLFFRSGVAELRIGDDENAIAWKTELYFYAFDKPDCEVTILGHSSFLDYFIATFDGEQSELELKPTTDLLELCLTVDDPG